MAAAGVVAVEGWFSKKPVADGDRFSDSRVAMNDSVQDVVRQKLGEAVRRELPDLVRREARADWVPGKARAVIGMRRAGKTSFLFQCLGDRLASGVPRDRLVYFHFEDERLSGMVAKDLGGVLEEYYRAFPANRREHRVTFCFDEIQVVPGWESFVRRILDSENIEVFVSGSSARMLSREVATSLRGRALETVITPFRFREFVRASGLQFQGGSLLTGQDVSSLRACFDEYLRIGGFPELVHPELRARQTELLQGYVESVMFRDVAERHGVSNLVALRAFLRQLVQKPASTISVNKVHADLRSRGIGVGKDALLAWLEHLEDAFLVTTVPIASRSVRRQQVNPKKLYVVDHALAAAFRASRIEDLGHALENLVACELQNRGSQLAYVRTDSGFEVDFLATHMDGSTALVQVAAEVRDPRTLERELRALADARAEFPEASALLLLGSDVPSDLEIPVGVEVATIWRWLLEL